MGYDRQRSPFGTRIYLTCYCFFLLINVFLDFNVHHPRKDFGLGRRWEWHLILYLLVSICIFILLLYGLWFARLFLLSLLLFLLLLFLIRTLLSLVFLWIEFDEERLAVDLFEHRLHFSSFHNHFWLIEIRQIWFQSFGLVISLFFNVLGIGASLHLCASIEHRERSWPYRKRPF